MKNVSRFLESPWRSDLFGYNLGCSTKFFDKNYVGDRRGGTTPSAQWETPRLGMPGVLFLGHQSDVENVLTVSLLSDEKPVNLQVTRNHWTPAWMDTIYRSDPDPAYYSRTGTLVVREKKMISRTDVFVSHLKITNEKRETVTVKVEIKMPFEEDGGIYRVITQTVPRSLGAHYPVEGYAAVVSDPDCRRMVLEIPPFGEVKLRYAMAFDPRNPEDARNLAGNILLQEDPFSENEREFNLWFRDHVPELDAENTDILKVYYYRWYVVYRSIHKPAKWIADHPIPRECMYESFFGDWFGSAVGLPVPWQVCETRWLKQSDVVKSHLENWCDDRTCYQAYIQCTPWAAWEYYKLHPDKEWLQKHYQAFAKWGRKLAEGDIPAPTKGSWWTGAEYQPSFYQYTEVPWDWRYDNEGRRDLGVPIQCVYRVDTIVYDILSLRGCAAMAEELGFQEEGLIFTKTAKELSDFVREKMWDAEKRFFFDIDVCTRKRCDQAPCYDGFAPFIEKVVGADYDKAFDRLWDNNWFQTDFMAPTAAKCCPMFWFDNCIAGPTASSVLEPHEYGCTWNGTVWPYANSLIAMGLGFEALENPERRQEWLDFFANYTELHFPYGDRGTPLVCEHYRCDDGATYSAANDYFHSIWIDLFMRFYVGIKVEGEKVAFAPFAKEGFSLKGVVIRGKEYTVEYSGIKGEVECKFRI